MRRRPLRWVKFGVYLAAAAATLLLTAAPLRELATIARGPYTSAPTIPAPWFWLPLAALSLVTLFALVRDAAFDRSAPKALLVAQLVGLLAAASAPALFLAPREPTLERRSGDEQLQFLLRWLADRGAGRLAREGRIPADERALTAAVRSVLAKSSFRGPSLTRIPPRVVVQVDAQGPVRSPRPSDAPGTLYVAIGASGRVGWVTAVGLGPDGLPALLRAGGQVMIAPILVRNERGAGERTLTPPSAHP